MPSEMVLGAEGFGRWFRSWGWSPHEWNQYSCKRDRTGLPGPFCHVRSLRPGTESSPNHTGILIVRNKFLLFMSHLVCGLLLQQPEWTKTRGKVKPKKKKKKKKKKSQKEWKAGLCIDGIKFYKRELLEGISFLQNPSPHSWGDGHVYCASQATFIYVFIWLPWGI